MGLPREIAAGIPGQFEVWGDEYKELPWGDGSCRNSCG